jgi:transcriptional regulator with XRE-family HTH domain|tara:strand:+ start:2450 stop:3190 length:741 start_codon:yes stop_codon:yes gene_type:complete
VRLFEIDDENIELQTKHDFRGFDFVWYNEPVDHFDLHSINHRVLSFQQLQYYAEVFFFLNPDIKYSIFQGYFRWISNRESGKTIRSYSKARVDQMTKEVYFNKANPYCRRMRRVVFNPEIIISFEEKMAVTAHMIKRGVSYTSADLLICVEKLSRAQIVVTQEALATELMCSRRTVSRIMNQKIKSSIEVVNKNIKREKAISNAIEWIDLLSDSGNKVKMQELKSLTNIRDYSIIKEAINRYEIEY